MDMKERTMEFRNERDNRIEILEDIYTSDITMLGMIDYINGHNNANDGYEYHFCIEMYAIIRFPRGLEFPYTYG